MGKEKERRRRKRGKRGNRMKRRRSGEVIYGLYSGDITAVTTTCYYRNKGEGRKQY